MTPADGAGTEGAGAEGLAKFILARASEDKVQSVLILRGDRSLPDLREGLTSGGILVSTIEVYRTRFLDADVSGLTAWLSKEDPVAAAFFSPSGVAALERLLPARARAAIHERAAAIARGHTTAKALDKHGYRHVFRPGGETTFETVAHEALLTACGGRP
jgi:uroporphyrinogen-III synthase